MDKKTQIAWYSKEVGKDKEDVEQHKKHLIAQIKKEGLNAVFEKKEVKKDYKVSIWNRILNNLKKRIGF